MDNQIWTHTFKSKYGCNTCVESNSACKSFKYVDKTPKPLWLIHSNVCDMKSNLSKGGNKYLITFIDDCTKLCYVNLLQSNDRQVQSV